MTGLLCASKSASTTASPSESFHREGDPAAEAWVRKHAQTILDGHPTRVAGALRRAATLTNLDPGRRWPNAPIEPLAIERARRSNHIDGVARTQRFRLAHGRSVTLTSPLGRG